MSGQHRRRVFRREMAAVITVAAVTAGMLSAVARPALAAVTAPRARPAPAPSVGVSTPSVLAAKTHQPVEFPAKRTPTSATWALPDGQERTVVGAGLINYPDAAGKLQPIDNTPGGRHHAPLRV